MDLQTKTTLRYYYKPIRMAKVSNTSKLNPRILIHCRWEGRMF